MPLITDDKAVDTAAVETAQAESQAPIEDTASVMEPEPEPTPVVEPEAKASTSTDVAARSSGEVTVSSRRAASQAAVLNDMAAAGHEGLKMDFSSFPGIVLKDGEFQLTGSTRCFNAQTGFDGVVTGSKQKFAMRVGGDDDGDVVFADDQADFSNPEKEACQKITDWRAEGLKPELKIYLECYTMLTEVYDEACKDLVGELVVVQVSPTSVGRYSGYAATQQFKHKVMPDQFVTHFCRGEKITSGKFPYYPWAFKFVELV